MDWIKKFKVGDQVIVSNKSNVTPQDIFDDIGRITYFFRQATIDKIDDDYISIVLENKCESIDGVNYKITPEGIYSTKTIGGFFNKRTHRNFIIEPTAELISAIESQDLFQDVQMLLYNIHNKNLNKSQYDKLKKFIETL